MSLVNSHCGFTPLQEIWLGDTYPASFYDHLPAAVRDAFYQITEWTKQDLAKIEQKLTELGVVVRRPEYHSIDDCVDANDNLLKPVIAARDDTLVLGDRIINLRNNFKTDPWGRYLDLYRESGATVFQQSQGPWACLSPPCMVRMGRDLYIDKIYHEHVWGFVAGPLIDLARDYRVHISMIDGHSDCVFCPVREGLILTTEYKKSYNQTFPGWQVYDINHSNRTRPRNMAAPGAGGFHQWHIPDQRIGANLEFAQHIQDKAQDWVGSYIESVFDVNLLIIDDKTILSVGDDDETFEFLTRQGYTVHAFDFRCRDFWDAGMHCLTNDIRRAGDQPDFFPERGGAALDWLIDE